MAEDEVAAALADQEEGVATDSTAAGDTAEVQPWDFAAPSRIPAEQLETIELLHQTFAATAPATLSTFLRSEVELELESVEQVTFSEYVKSLSAPTCIAVMDMQPLSGYAVMEINSVLLYSLIDKMLGGDGDTGEIKRPFTDLELTISKKFFNMVLSELSAAWSSILTLSFTVREFHTNPAAVRVIPTREAGLVVTLKARIDDANGLMTLTIPYMSLEPIAAKLGNKQFNNRYSKKQPEEIAAAHRRNFSAIDVDVAALLGNTQLSMVELLSLQKGDILSLGQRVHEPIDLTVAGKKKFSATPGLVGKYKGVVINEEVNDG